MLIVHAGSLACARGKGGGDVGGSATDDRISFLSGMTKKYVILSFKKLQYCHKLHFIVLRTAPGAYLCLGRGSCLGR